MDRRHFLKIAALTGAGLSFPGGVNALMETAAASPSPDLAVVSGGPPEKIVKAALDALGGIKKFMIHRFDLNGNLTGFKTRLAFTKTCH